MTLPFPLLLRSELVGVAMDATVYCEDLTATLVDTVVRLFVEHCHGQSIKYQMPESFIWDNALAPALPLARGKPLGFMETVTARVRGDRPVRLRLWNGSLDSESVSVTCIRVPRLTGDRPSAMVRLLAPATSAPAFVRTFMIQTCQESCPLSGHAGYVFTYDSSRRRTAFDQIFSLAKRFKGIDVEDINALLPLMRSNVKGTNWITLVGKTFASLLNTSPMRAFHDANVTVECFGDATAFVARSAPAIIDCHRGSDGLESYTAVSCAIAPLIPRGSVEFAGAFGRQELTTAWLHRFDEPLNW